MEDTDNAIDYRDADHAKKYKRLIPKGDRKSAKIDQDFEHLMYHGYVVIEELAPLNLCEQIKQCTLKLLDKVGRNNFEGYKTQRVYDVLSKTRLTDYMAEHPRVLGLMDKLFQPGFLLSQSQLINILPGETAQALHFDDGFYRIPRPRQALGAAAIWAIDDFTKDNGATVVIPQSHLWDDKKTAATSDAISIVMPAGSLVFFLGTTWHGGGQNQSSDSRLALTHQYCDAYLRQQENYLLELSKETVRSLSPEMQSLVGYSIYPPFMGMVDGKHPLRLLE